MPERGLDPGGGAGGCPSGGAFRAVRRARVHGLGTTSRDAARGGAVADHFDVSALAPSFAAFARNAVLHTNPACLARAIRLFNAEHDALARRARAAGAPVAAVLTPRTFGLGGGRTVHERFFCCHDPATGRSYLASVTTVDGRGPAWLA